MGYLAISGPAEATADEYDDALRAGRWAAEHGHVVLCGGLGGVMEAAARGTQEGGGTSVGLLPGTRRQDGNRYLTVAIATGLGEVRNALLVRASDVVLCIGGSWGTLSELALAVRTGVPAVTLRTPFPLELPGPTATRTLAGALEAVRSALDGAEPPGPGRLGP